MEEGTNEYGSLRKTWCPPMCVWVWVRYNAVWLTSHRLWVTTAGSLSTVLRWWEKCFVALLRPCERWIKRHSRIYIWIIDFMLCASPSACPCHLSFLFLLFSLLIYLFISPLRCCKLGRAGCDISSRTRGPTSLKPRWNPIVIWRLYIVGRTGLRRGAFLS